jgi:hypothetical protein
MEGFDGGAQEPETRVRLCGRETSRPERSTDVGVMKSHEEVDYPLQSLFVGEPCHPDPLLLS